MVNNIINNEHHITYENTMRTLTLLSFNNITFIIILSSW